MRHRRYIHTRASVAYIKYKMAEGMAPHISSAPSLKRVDKNESHKQK